MTQREVIKSYYQEIIKFGWKSDENPLSDRQVLRKIKGTLVSFKYKALTEKSDLVNEFDKITLCVKLRKVNMTDDYPGGASPDKWHRSINLIPRHIKIFNVTDIGSKLNMDYVEWGDVLKRENIRLESLKNKPIYSLKYENEGVHLFVKLPIEQNWESCLYECIPEDYYKALIFPKCGKVNKDYLCNPLDTEIGASNALVMQTIEYLIRGQQPVIDIKDNDSPIQ